MSKNYEDLFSDEEETLSEAIKDFEKVWRKREEFLEKKRKISGEQEREGRISAY